MDLDQFHTLLHSLGSSSEEVAHSLAEKKITGWRKASNHCPIANFLKGEACKDGSWLSFGVTPISIYVYDHDSKTDVSMKTPPVIASFVNDFDDNRYSFLETPIL